MTHTPTVFGGNICAIQCSCGYRTGEYRRARTAWKEYNHHQSDRPAPARNHWGSDKLRPRPGRRWATRPELADHIETSPDKMPDIFTDGGHVYAVLNNGYDSDWERLDPSEATEFALRLLAAAKYAEEGK